VSEISILTVVWRRVKFESIEGETTILCVRAAQEMCKSEQVFLGKRVNVKFSRYMPKVALGVPEG
jgi:hypothetical protein